VSTRSDCARRGGGGADELDEHAAKVTAAHAVRQGESAHGGTYRAPQQQGASGAEHPRQKSLTWNDLQSHP